MLDGLYKIRSELIVKQFSEEGLTTAEQEGLDKVESELDRLHTRQWHSKPRKRPRGLTVMEEIRVLTMWEAVKRLK